VDIKSFNELLTPAGQEALQAAKALEPRERDFLRHFDNLCRQFPPNLSRAAIETAIWQQEAAKKFPNQPALYLTREALEQASNYEISIYRAERFSGMDIVLDLGCSVGSDTLAFAKFVPATGVDIDPLRLAMARANTELSPYKNPVDFVQADLQAPLSFAVHASTGLFFDPGRRKGGRRALSVHQYAPPLSIVRQWLPLFPVLGVKISPGVNLLEIAQYEAELEFISLRGELKEAVLWFGSLRTARRRATLLPGLHTMTEKDSGGEDNVDLQPRIREPLAYLYEPDPAVLRAGLVRSLAEKLDAFHLDPDIAYLTAPDLKQTPFARAWQIEAWLPFNLKRLRKVLRERNVGNVIVKKRGSPLEPEKLIHDLRLKGNEQRVLFLTHLRGKPIVILCLPRKP